LVSLRKYPLLINSSLVANRAIESSATAIIRTEPVNSKCPITYYKIIYSFYWRIIQRKQYFFSMKSEQTIVVVNTHIDFQR
jgi:hypothetical protein